MNPLFLGYPFWCWSIVCLAIAIAYYYVWPKPKPWHRENPRPFWMYMVLRWAHSIVWVFLFFSCLWAQMGWIGFAKFTAILGLFTYISFMVVFMIDKVRR